MTVELCAGVWRTRGGKMVIVRRYKENAGWMGTDGNHRWNDGRYTRSVECSLDLVEYIGEEVPEAQPEPQPEQPDAAEELAALKDDRDRWQARAKQAEGRVSTLGQELATVRLQLRETEQQLEAAAHSPDLRGEVERVAAERDAAREEVRGLQARAGQAEGDARNATAKMSHLESEAAKWRAQVMAKNDMLIRAEAANDALQVVIVNLFREVHSDD